MNFARLTLLMFVASPLTAAPKPWQVWTNVTLVDHPHNDGDSFRARLGTNEFTLRLYAVDCPETTATLKDRLAEQARHWSVTVLEVRALGHRAAEFSRTNLLAGPFTVRTRDEHTLSGGRRYAYVRLADGRDLGEALLGAGLGRAKGFAPVPPPLSELVRSP